MKKILLALTLLFSSCAFAGSELELNKVKLPEAISLIYSEVLKVPYMLDPQLVNDERMITFRLTPDIDEREFVTRYLGNMNIRIWTKKGVDFIAPYTLKEPVKPRYTWTYTPQYRSVAYHSSGLIMEKFMTHQELKVMLLKDPAFRAAYEAESQNPQSGYQIIRHHGDGTEEVVFDSRVSGTDLPTATG